jgi:hypothetical protein
MVSIFLAYAFVWVRAHAGYLLDPALQNDDARGFMFAFHRWDSGALTNDPVAAEMLGLTGPAYSALYFALTPWLGLFWAAKAVQLVCFGIVAAAAALLSRSPRAGLAAGVLLLFVFLHTGFIVNRVAGGLPRSFAFPAFALWCAGAVTRSERARFAAGVIGALMYPTAMALVLAAEGLFALRGAFTMRRRPLVRRLGRYGVLVAVCLVLVAPNLVRKPEDGHVYTIAEAEQESAFGPGGRDAALPFPNAIVPVAEAVFEPFSVGNQHPTGEHQPPGSDIIPLLVIAVLLLPVVAYVTPFPMAALCFAVGSVVVFAASRTFAFRLYLPERYYSMGMPAAGMVFAVCVVGLLLPRWRRRWREVARALAASAFMVGLWFVCGDGITINNGMTVNDASPPGLHAALRRLPVNARIASLPDEGDDAQFWAARASVVATESLQPWLTTSWARQKLRLDDTVKALYATRREDVLSYCQRYGVTHLVLRKEMYGPAFAKNADLFEPLRTMINMRLGNVAMDDFVLGHVPPTAVEQVGAFQIVDVQKLQAAWSGSP